VPAPLETTGVVRPLLRGWVHALAAPVAILVAWWLWRAAAPGLPRLGMAIFGAGLVGLYATSGAYHLPPWPSRVRRRLARLDVAMIQLFIAASFTPIAVLALRGPWRTWSLAVVWSIGILGAMVAASPMRAPRWLSVTAYVAFGMLAAVPLVRVVGVIPPAGLALIVTGGLLYAVGAVVYARRHPDPWPEIFGFHEVFHVLVVVACGVHVAAVWRYALPLA
jgi:hemolysin III